MKNILNSLFKKQDHTKMIMWMHWILANIYLMSSSFNIKIRNISYERILMTKLH